MKIIPPMIRTKSVNAVVEYTTPPDENGGQCLKLFQAYDIIGAWSWLRTCTPAPGHVLKAKVGLLELDTAEGPTHVVTCIEPDDGIDVIELIPFTYEEDPDELVYRFQCLAMAMAGCPLRTFLSDVFSLSVVYKEFWTAPGSRFHHHAYKGGLASHSIEMAENVQNMWHLPVEQRHLGMAYAMTHDLGKIWCYDPALRDVGGLCHETVGLANMEHALAKLERAWPDGALAMRSFLSGKWKMPGNKPIMAVGSIVRALDQLSAESDLRPRDGHRFQPWVPAPPKRECRSGALG